MSALGAILHQLCPRCRMGSIFRGSLWRGFPRMHERCPVCALKFEREEGYFVGAMYISYAIAVVMIAALSVAVWLVARSSLDRVVLWGVLLFLPFAPTITLFSRVLWIYLDRAADPEHEP